MRCFIHVVAPEGRLVPIHQVLIGWSMSRVGEHDLNGHTAIPLVCARPKGFPSGPGTTMCARCHAPISLSLSALLEAALPGFALARLTFFADWACSNVTRART